MEEVLVHVVHISLLRAAALQRLSTQTPQSLQEGSIHLYKTCND